MDKVTIFVSKSIKSKSWVKQDLCWGDFANLFSVNNVKQSSISQLEYSRLDRSQQSQEKDKGGYIGAILKGSERSKKNILSRTLITLDIDDIKDPNVNIDGIIENVKKICTKFVVHTTRNHSQDKPKYRIILAVSRLMNLDEYDIVSRWCANEVLGIHNFDPTTFQAERLMLFPTKHSDGIYEVYSMDENPLFVDEVFDKIANDSQGFKLLIESKTKHIEGDLSRELKEGCKIPLIQDFCNNNTIHEAIERYIPNIYLPTTTRNRYTYCNSTGVGGAVVYENGNLLYSFHANDPYQGIQMNAFDVVRLHLFGNLDQEGEKIYSTKSSSYKAMQKMLYEQVALNQTTHVESQDIKTTTQSVSGIDLTSYMEIHKNTKDSLKASQETGFKKLKKNELVKLLNINKHNDIIKSYHNFEIIFKHDMALQGLFRLDLSNNMIEVTNNEYNILKQSSYPRHIEDVDITDVSIYLSKAYDLKVSTDDVFKIINSRAQRMAYHPIKEKILSKAWDGVERLNGVLQHVFNVDDNMYTKEVFKVMMCALVARVFEPGVKFDEMMILVSKSEGVGKTTFLQKLALKDEWYCGVVGRIDEKEGMERVQASWLVNFDELKGFDRDNFSVINTFLSQTHDKFRAPYARTVQNSPRQCVFFGTTNEVDFLTIDADHRRYYPILIESTGIDETKVLSLTEDDVLMYYAEAFYLWSTLKNQSLLLSKEAKSCLKDKKDIHKYVDSRMETIAEYLKNHELSELEGVSIRDIWFGALNNRMDKYPSRKEAIGVSNLLKLLGYTKIKTARDNKNGVIKKFYKP